MSLSSVTLVVRDRKVKQTRSPHKKLVTFSIEHAMDHLEKTTLLILSIQKHIILS